MKVKSKLILSGQIRCPENIPVVFLTSCMLKSSLIYPRNRTALKIVLGAQNKECPMTTTATMVSEYMKAELAVLAGKTMPRKQLQPRLPKGRSAID